MEFRKMLMITVYAEQKKRHRFIEQSFRLYGRRRGLDVSREQHRNMFSIFSCAVWPSVCPLCCCCLVTKLYLTLRPCGLSPSGSSVHGISQTRILEWVAFSFSRWSSWPGDRTCNSCLAGGFFTAGPPGKSIYSLL